MNVKIHPISYFLIALAFCLLFQGCGQEEEVEKQSVPDLTLRDLSGQKVSLRQNLEQVAQSAPDFTLQDLSGKPVSLRQHKGQVVLLDFWATWCTPCRRSIPELVVLQEKYRDQGLVVLGVSADNPRDTSVNALLAFKERFKINYSILLADRNITRSYFPTGQIPLPTLFVIDREGMIVDSIVGYKPGVVERSLKKLI
jgi:peroxiredoxin